MEIKITATPKEIAALVVALQGQQDKEKTLVKIDGPIRYTNYLVKKDHKLPKRGLAFY